MPAQPRPIADAVELILNLDRATPEQRADLARVLVERPARPFFLAAAAEAAERAVLGVAPPDGLEPPTRTLGRCRSVH